MTDSFFPQFDARSASSQESQESQESPVTIPLFESSDEVQEELPEEYLFYINLISKEF